MTLYSIGQRRRGSGIITQGIAGEVLLRGEAVCLSNSDGRWYRADADGASTMSVVGVTAERCAVIGQQIRIVLQGFVGRGDWNWTRGAPLYITTVPGAMSHTIPVAPAITQQIATAITSTLIYVDPSNAHELGSAIGCELLEGATAIVGFDECKEPYANYFLCDGVADNVQIQAAVDYATNGLILLEAGDYDMAAKVTITDWWTILRGSGNDTVLSCSMSDYAIEITGINTKLEYFKIDGNTVGSGIYANGANDIIIEQIHVCDTATAFKIRQCSRSRLHLVEALAFTNYGIHYETTGLIADQYLDNFYIESATPTAVGIKTDEGVNGLRFSNGLIAGALKQGLAYGVDIQGSYCGVWLNNIVIDQIYGTGIRFYSTANQGTIGIQAVNIWCQSCGGHGIVMQGTSTNKILDGDFTNLNLMGNDYTGLKMQYAEWMSFQNCKIMNNAQENLASNVEMTNLLIYDITCTTVFDNCWFGWMDGWVASNRQRPVLVRAQNDQVTLVKFEGCQVRDPAGDGAARIEYYETGTAHVYVYGYGCFTNNFVSSPNDTLFVIGSGSNPGTIVEEINNHIGKVFGW